MTLNNAHEALMESRRLQVARLRVKGLTVREIAYELEKLGVINPDTGKGYTLPTIHNDIEIVKERWRKDYSQAINEHQKDMLAEIDEAKRKAWKDGDLPNLIRLLDRESKLLGLDAPHKQAFTDVEGRSISFTIKMGDGDNE